MKRVLMATLVVAVLAGAGLQAGQRKGEIKADECFFLSSLHYTANGMGYWYGKEQGGLESLTKIPYDQLGCKNCHTPGCDGCHKKEVVEKQCSTFTYSVKAASNQGLCLKCHGREKAMIGINHANKQDDVHLAQGMSCTDCHSAREMHGDGTDYVSLKQPGAMDTKCENCHEPVKPTTAHTVHGEKLDCKACHLRHVVSCTNCHFDTMVEQGKRKAIPVSGWLFLMNCNGKVSSASMQTFVSKNRTFLMFAPHMSHSVTAEGRTCGECHDTPVMRQALEGRVALTWLENGKVQNLKGVIPVSDRVDYDCSYQNLVDGKWVPINNPPMPMRQYVAYGTPLSREQMEKLAVEQEAPAPAMEKP